MLKWVPRILKLESIIIKSSEMRVANVKVKYNNGVRNNSLYLPLEFLLWTTSLELQSHSQVTEWWFWSKGFCLNYWY